MACSGNGADHCCWFKGKVCKYLEENTIPGRRWVCGLMREHNGDWDATIADPRYQRDIMPLMQRLIWPGHGVEYTCKTWPSKGCECDR